MARKVEITYPVLDGEPQWGKVTEKTCYVKRSEIVDKIVEYVVDYEEVPETLTIQFEDGCKIEVDVKDDYFDDVDVEMIGAIFNCVVSDEAKAVRKVIYSGVQNLKKWLNEELTYYI